MEKLENIVDREPSAADVVHANRMLVGEIEPVHREQLTAAIARKGRGRDHAAGQLDSWNLAQDLRQVLAQQPLLASHTAPRWSSQAIRGRSSGLRRATIPD